MKPRSCSPSSIISSALLVLLLRCFCIPVARSQTTADSCTSSSLAAVSHLIPFDTANLTCLDAWTSQGFILRYGNSAQNNTWSFVLSAPDGGAYVSVGFSSDGAMVGSSAMAGWTTGSGVGVAKQYRLGGTSSGSCPPDQGSLALVPGTTLLVAQSSRLYLAFQFTAAQPTPYLIYAVGPSGAQLSNDYLVQHRSYTSASVNYATGVSSSAGGASGSKKLHGAMAALGWGVLMPLGVALARYFKRHDPFWFYAHISVQGVGFVLGTAGVVAGFRLNDDVSGADTHQAIGITILVCGCLQVLAFLARPDKSSKFRRYWNWYHHNVGRAAVVCAIANVFIGLSIAHEATAASAFYGIFIALWVIASLVLEVRLWRTAA
ncbi:hypothetical protein U9M48_016871 [Paspalum notatum var. saurae]|uniref:Cytochrome b561 and DOMON domain-containing protein n=1 Tax=Paspalum notatum var. saurae TaxID=547442 RepID=A0AAQ3WN96_PASNO